MARNRYFVSYDITEDRRRTRVYKLMLAFGDRVQYSVFSCDLNARELVELRAAVEELVQHSEDQVLVVNLGPADGRGDSAVECIGRSFLPEERIRVV